MSYIANLGSLDAKKSLGRKKAVLVALVTVPSRAVVLLLLMNCFCCFQHLPGDVWAFVL